MVWSTIGGSRCTETAFCLDLPVDMERELGLWRREGSDWCRPLVIGQRVTFQTSWKNNNKNDTSEKYNKASISDGSNLGREESEIGVYWS